MRPGLHAFVQRRRAYRGPWSRELLCGPPRADRRVARDGLEHPERYGIDFAITATFLAIVAVGVRHRTDLVVAVAAGIVAGALRLVGATTLAVLVAGAVAPIVVLLARDEPSDTAESPFRMR